MTRVVLEEKINSLLFDLKTRVESQTLTENEVFILKSEIDKILYECLYFKSKLIS